MGNASSKSDHHGDKNADYSSLLQSMNPDLMPVEGNSHVTGEQEIKQAKVQGDLPSTSETVEHISSECPGRIIAASDEVGRAEDLQNGVLSNNEPSIPSLDRAHSEYVESRGVGLDELVASPSFSQGASDLEDACHKPCSGVEHIPEKSSLDSTVPSVAGGIPENDQASLKPEISNGVVISGNVEESCSPSDALVSNAVCPLESPGQPVLENVEAQACHELKDPEILNPDEEMPSTRIHVLKACNSHLNQAETLVVGGDNLVVVPGLPSEVDGPCSLETSGREDGLQYFWSSH
ncbi:hypothetical protein L1049_019287 [Liquidambar formosana]|uniref:Uncharacterized protein n=1 Tax=Liquidambar formosana TaxID=63359 RepID=A0AAP0S686_LIQFO